MERRALLAAVLSMLVLIVWQQLFPPPPQPEVPASTSAPASSPAVVGAQPAPSASPVTSAASDVPGAVPSPDVDLPSVQKTLETSLYKVVLTSDGGGISGFWLKDYPAYVPEHGPLTTFTSLFSGGLPPLPNDPTNLLDAPYPASTLLNLEGMLKETDRYRVVSASDKQVVFERQTGAVKVTRVYNFQPDSYEVKLEQTLQNISGSAVTVAPVLSLYGKRLDPEKEGKSSYAPHLHASYLMGGEHEIVQPSDFEEQPKKLVGSVQWAAVDDRYFLRALVAEKAEPATITLSHVAPLVMKVSLDLGAMTLQAGQSRTLKHSLFLGPKVSEQLDKAGAGLLTSLDYGILGPISQVLLWLLKQFYAAVQSWGLAIMLLTLLVKAVLYPLFYKQIESAQKMKEFQPQMKALQEKHGEDKVRLNQEMMRFMQENKVNPLGGCLPLLLQMPIWFALYHVLQNAVELYRETFLYLPDLSASDPYGVSPVILGVLMFVQQKMTPPAPGMDPMQVKILQYMPLMFAAMMFTLPSGLVVYIMVNTVLGIAQQWYITQKLEREAAQRVQVRPRV
ncbi:MAG: membrane protein insertase YidC [Myxococcota bacterium]